MKINIRKPGTPVNDWPLRPRKPVPVTQVKGQVHFKFSETPLGKGKPGHFVKAGSSLKPQVDPEHYRFRVLAIDPATYIERTGIACLSVPMVDRDGKRLEHQAQFDKTGRTRIKPRVEWAGTLDQAVPFTGKVKEEGWRLRGRVISMAVRSLLSSCLNRTGKFWYPSLVLLETPMNYQSGKGQSAALAGDLLALGYTAGRISAVLGERNRLVLEVEPPTWKGQLPKQIIGARLSECYRDQVEPVKNHNALDAIGLAHWFLMQRTPAETDRCSFVGSIGREHFRGWL